MVELSFMVHLWSWVLRFPYPNHLGRSFLLSLGPCLLTSPSFLSFIVFVFVVFFPMVLSFFPRCLQALCLSSLCAVALLFPFSGVYCLRPPRVQLDHPFRQFRAHPVSCVRDALYQEHLPPLFVESCVHQLYDLFS